MIFLNLNFTIYYFKLYNIGCSNFIYNENYFSKKQFCIICYEINMNDTNKKPIQIQVKQILILY